MKNLYYKSERSFSNSLDHKLIAILADIFSVPESEVRIANDYEDIYHASDIIISGKIRIALRVRRGKWGAFVREFTVRYDLALNGVPHDGDTEYQKIMSGHGDFMLYAIATPDNQNIMHWVLIDLRSYRMFAEYEENKYGGPKPDRIKHARNTGCGFLVYKIDGNEEPFDVVVADSEHWEVK